MPMALFRLWLWRFAMLACGVTLFFFAAVAVAPQTTTAEAILENVVMRARYWSDYGFAVLQLLGVVLWLLVAFTAGQWARGLKVFAAAVVLFAGLMAMVSEYGSLLGNGTLRDTAEVARHKLMVSRGITVTLAAVSLGLGWWARLQQPKTR